MFRTNLVTPSLLAFQIGLNFVRFHVDVIVDFVYCEIIVFSSFFIIIFLFFIQVKPLKMFLIIFSRTRSNRTPETTFFFSYNEVEPHQSRVLWMVLLKSKPRMHNPIHQNCVFANSWKFFVGLNLEYLGIQLIPSLQTSRLHLDYLMKIFYTQTSTFNHRIAQEKTWCLTTPIQSAIKSTLWSHFGHMKSFLNKDFPFKVFHLW